MPCTMDQIYLASVLNSKAGIDKEINNLSKVASSHNVKVIMSNYIGESGGYEAAGKSSIWDDNGGVSCNFSLSIFP